MKKKNIVSKPNKRIELNKHFLVTPRYVGYVNLPFPISDDNFRRSKKLSICHKGESINNCVHCEGRNLLQFAWEEVEKFETTISSTNEGHFCYNFSIYLFNGINPSILNIHTEYFVLFFGTFRFVINYVYLLGILLLQSTINNIAEYWFINFFFFFDNFNCNNDNLMIS